MICKNLSTSPLFNPWVGSEYGPSSRFIIPVMILGESHHSQEEPDSNLTIRMIESELDGGSGKAFYTKIVQSVIGHSPAAQERAEFWNSVVFYNYVQQIVGTGPRKRPTKGMWVEAETPFRNVIERYHPKLVIVFGFESWESLPNSGKDVEPIKAGSSQTEAYEFSLLEGATVLAPKLMHPTAKGFSAKTWYPVIEESIKRAGGKPWAE